MSETLDLFGTEAKAERIGCDERPLEMGGAVVVLRLSPAEVALLLPRAPTLVEAVHAVLAKEAAA